MKHTPKIMFILLLAIVATLLILNTLDLTVLGKTTDDNDVGNDGKQTQLPNTDDKDKDTDNGNSDTQNPDTNEPDDPVIKAVFEDILPKLAEAHGYYNYTQQLEANLPIECNTVLQTPQVMFIVGTYFDEGLPFVFVLSMDNEGTLTALYQHLESMTFFDAKITTDGITVLAGGTATKLLVFDTSLSAPIETGLPFASGGRLYSMFSGYLVTLFGGDYPVFFISDNTVLNTGKLPAGEIEAVIEEKSGYLFAVNSADSYSLVRLGKGLQNFSKTTVPQRNILRLLPIVEDGLQKFVIAEKSSANDISVVKYDNNFAPQKTVAAGNAESADVFANGSSILLMLRSDAVRMYIMDFKLNFRASSEEYFEGISGLFAAEECANGYILLMEKESVLTLVDIRNDGFVTVTDVGIAATRAIVRENLNGSISIFYRADNTIYIVNLNV